MKKLIVGITVPGSVVLIEGQLKYFADKGYKTYLLAPDDELTRNYCEREGCTLLPVKIRRDIAIFADLVSLIKIIRHFRKVKPDVVNVGTPKMGLLGTTAGFLTRVPKRIFTCRGFRFESERGFKRVLLKSLDKLTSSFAHKVICISPSVKEFGVKQGVLSEQKSFVIQHGSSNGLCLERFNSLKISWEKKINIKEKLSLGDTFVFGFIGRLVKDKGIEELLKAFDNINKEYNKTSLIVLGSTKSSTSYEKNLILHYKNHTGIRWVGFVENVNEYIAIMDVFVMPTYREGFGIALLEAAAMGKPVISTNVTGAKDAVKNNYNGLLVSHKSISDLENAMLKLYKDNSLKEKLGKNGIEWARNFDNNIIWEGMNKLYNS